MKVTVDTNVLVRALMQDDPVQASAAAMLLSGAEPSTIVLPTLRELVWVLLRRLSCRCQPQRLVGG